MKKIYLLLTVFFICSAQAQVPNSSFEQTLGYAHEVLRYWGHTISLPMSIDLDGTVTSEIIQFDEGQLSCSFPSADPHTGEKALKITNVFNQTLNTVIAGKANLFNEEISELPTGWNNGIPLPENTTIEFLGFHYKFFPMGNDVAQATLELFNADSESIGTAVIDISEAASEYTYISVPVAFTMTGAPTFMTIEFNMAKEGSQPVFGSSLIVDDIVVNNAALGLDSLTAPIFTVYPSITDGLLNISSTTATNGSSKIVVSDVNGRIVMQDVILSGTATLNITSLPAAMYFLKIENAAGSSITKFIRK